MPVTQDAKTSLLLVSVELENKTGKYEAEEQVGEKNISFVEVI